MSKQNAEFNFAKENHVDDMQFNHVIWIGVKGLNSPCPQSVSAIFFIQEEEDDDN